MKAILITISCILMMPFPAWAQKPDAKKTRMSETEEEVRFAESRRFEAMMRGDVKLLDRLLADDLTYTHTTGIVDTKADFLAALASGQLKYELIEPDDVQVRVYGATGVVTGRATMKIRAQGQERKFQIRFTEVYVKQHGRWQLVAWQSTRWPEQ